MKRTTTSIDDMKKLNDVVTAHTEKDGKMITIPFTNWDNMGGAGALNSSAIDMTRWIMLQLNKGTLDGKTFFSSNSASNMWQAYTSLQVSKMSEELYPSTHFRAYGLGWSLMDYHGRKVISHSGGYDGIISYCAFVPEDNFGFVILTNANSSLYHPLSYRLLDTWLKKPETDWSTVVLERVRKNEEVEREKSVKEENARVKDSRPSLPLEQYTGLYGGNMYGNASVFIENGILKVRLEPAPLFVGEMRHWQYNSFAVRMINFPSLPEGKINFIIDVDGTVEEMKIDIPNPDFYFTELEFKRIY
jgi:CubicO group peptidase (beta-lactamase class C family)